MTSNRIDFQLTDSGFRQRIQAMLASGADIAPLMRTIAGHLAAGAEVALESETDPTSGMPWPALAPATIKRRTKLGKWPGKMLQVSGALAQSVVPESGADYAEVVVGEHYAFHHQHGTSRMPRRGILGVSADTEANILDATERYFEQVLLD